MNTNRTRRLPRARARTFNVDLYEKRVNAGLSPVEVAWKAGISREYYLKIEKGYTPAPGVQFKIAKQFGRLPLDLWPLERQRVAA